MKTFPRDNTDRNKSSRSSICGTLIKRGFHLVVGKKPEENYQYFLKCERFQYVRQACFVRENTVINHCTKSTFIIAQSSTPGILKKSRLSTPVEITINISDRPGSSTRISV